MALRHPKPTVEQNAGRLVRRAAQVLEDRRWIQGGVGSSQNGMCVRGAICFAATGTTNFIALSDPTYRAEVQFSRWLVRSGAIQDLDDFQRINALGQCCGQDVTLVPEWNDAKGRTKEEVVQYMRKFADEVDPQLK